MENLRIGTEVEFRVITVNILGRESFPSDTSPTYQVVGECSLETYVVQAILINSLLLPDKPFPPGTPRVDDVDTIDDNGRNCVKTHCSLSWTPPESVQVCRPFIKQPGLSR